MNHTEFSRAIDALGLTQVGAARFLGVDPRACRRYVAGELPASRNAHSRPGARRRREARWAIKPQPGLACVPPLTTFGRKLSLCSVTHESLRLNVCLARLERCSSLDE